MVQNSRYGWQPLLCFKKTLRWVSEKNKVKFRFLLVLCRSLFLAFGSKLERKACVGNHIRIAHLFFILGYCFFLSLLFFTLIQGQGNKNLSVKAAEWKYCRGESSNDFNKAYHLSFPVWLNSEWGQLSGGWILEKMCQGLLCWFSLALEQRVPERGE